MEPFNPEQLRQPVTSSDLSPEASVLAPMISLQLRLEGVYSN